MNRLNRLIVVVISILLILGFLISCLVSYFATRVLLRSEFVSHQPPGIR